MRSQDHVDLREGSLGLLSKGCEWTSEFALEQCLCDAVVARVRIGLGIVDQVTRVRAEVCATDKLHAQCEISLSGGVQVACEHRGGRLEVCLVRAVDNGLLVGVLVVLAHVVERPVVDAVLDRLLLCVEKEADAALGRERADLVDGISEGLRWRKTLGEGVEGLTTCAGKSRWDMVSYTLASMRQKGETTYLRAT